MARIFYSLCGEGRGHATRVRAVVEALRGRHEVVVFASGNAYSMLAPLYARSDVRVSYLHGLRLHYDTARKLRYLRTGFHWGRYLTTMNELVDSVAQAIDREAPDLAITDLEPILPRAAERTGLPYISLDHQHVLVTSDLGELPAEVRLHAAFLSSVVQWFYTGQEDTIVSSFYAPPLRSDCGRVTQVGVMLRPEVLGAEVESGDHLVAYLRRFGSRRILDALSLCGRPVRVYGLGAGEARGGLSFHDVDPLRFVEDLATSHAVVSTAGNQLVGEALYLRKPVLALPEAGNYEQVVNAHYLVKAGCGASVGYEGLEAADVRRFLAEAETYRPSRALPGLVGNHEVVAAVEADLERLARKPPRPRLGESIAQWVSAWAR